MNTYLARKAFEKNRCLSANGYYSMEYPEEIPAGGYPYAHAVFTFGTQVAKVLVDLGAGKVTVEEIIAVHDAGRVVNPDSARGQLEGGCLMGVGYTLMEELVVVQGKTLNPSLSASDPYIKRCSKHQDEDCEITEPYGPYGAKGMGKSPLTPTTPSRC